MESKIARGYLVLADISGFTSFVASSELDHSQEILSEIFKLILRRFNPHLSLAEIEGDAVFAFASDQQLPRGETLLEIIEATYLDFRDRQRSMHRNVTCTCTACQTSVNLDLKFITHYGDFVLQDVRGNQKPLGSSVNLLHRLTKNRVKEATGWRGYAMFTEASLDRMDVHPLNVHTQMENYEHLGDVTTYSVNLDDRYRELTDERRVVVVPENADVVLSVEFSVPPATLWDWLNDPKKRNLWMQGAAWHENERPQGRTARGATNHCSNSDMLEYVLDWRPFSYYTVTLSKKPISFTITARLDAIPHGTRLTWCALLNGSLPRWILRPVCRRLIAKKARTRDGFAALAGILESRAAVERGTS